MPDQKPALDYGRPDPRPKGLPLDIAIIVVLAAFGFAFLAEAIAGCRGFVEIYETDLAYRQSEPLHGYALLLTFVVFFSACGLFLLWWAWRKIKRISRR